MISKFLAAGLLAALAHVALLSVARHDERPNFSGTWKLNREKTNYGPFPIPKDDILVVRTIGLNLEVTHTSDGRLINKALYIPDGVARVQRDQGGEVQVKVSWDGSELVFEREYKDRRNPSWRGRWLLSGDGKVLTAEGDFVFSSGERVHARVVYEKQRDDTATDSKKLAGGSGGVIGGFSGAGQRVRVDSRAMEAYLEHRVDPVYPPLAMQARIQGDVVLKAVIGKDGKVEQLSVASGHPLLIKTAMDAVRQWKYKPFMVNRKPVLVETQITVQYTLKKD